MFLTPVALKGDLAIVFGWPGTCAFRSVLLLLLGPSHCNDSCAVSDCIGNP